MTIFVKMINEVPFPKPFVSIKLLSHTITNEPVTSSKPKVKILDVKLNLLILNLMQLEL